MVQPSNGKKVLCPSKPSVNTEPWLPEERPSASIPPLTTLPVFLLALLCLMLAASGCSLRSSNVTTTPPVSSAKVKGQGQKICNLALSTIGTRYVYGGTTRKGFDCSGLVVWSYVNCGIKDVPRTAREQSKVGRKIPKSALRPGDIVAFKVGRGMHTGIYTGKGKFVHSPSKGKTVRVDSLDNKYWRPKFLGGRRHTRLQ